jgi:hypothetical protein
MALLVPPRVQTDDLPSMLKPFKFCDYVTKRETFWGYGFAPEIPHTEFGMTKMRCG